MRRLSAFLLAALLSATLLCIGTMAADPDTDGICNLSADASVTVFCAKADGTSVQNVTGYDGKTSFYPNAEKLNVHYDGVEGKFYCVFVLSGSSSLPTEDNIVFVDQQTAGSNGVDFCVFPSALLADTDYHVFLSSNAESGLIDFTEVASFSYYTAKADVLLGDVNGDKAIDVQDAMKVIRHFMEIELLDDAVKPAANVNGDSAIDVQDAMKIIRHFMEIEPITQ